MVGRITLTALAVPLLLAGCSYQQGGCGSGPLTASAAYVVAEASPTWGTVRVKVTDANGVPQANAGLSVVRASGYFLFCPSPSLTQRTGADGTAFFDRVLPAHYQVGFLGGLPPYTLVDFKVVAGQHTDVTMVAKPDEAGASPVP